MVFMNRSLMIIGNWKMYKTIGEALKFVSQLPSTMLRQGDVYLAVPFTALFSLVQAVGQDIAIGVQNISEHQEGAYTGETSVKMVQEAGATFALLGHSERRKHYHETNQNIAHKVKLCLQEGIKPVLCIGETEQERLSGKTGIVLEEQLSAGIAGLSSEEMVHIVVAYEPVWAIGTGKSATAEMAQDAHKLCRDMIKKRYSSEIADRIPILYGGSVNAKTIKELIEQPDIDGALVGGASLEVDSFVKIVTIAREYKS